MVIVITILVVVALAGLFASGVASGKAGNPPTASLPGDGKSSADCAQACARWDNARQMQCNAKADEAAARSRADGIRGLMLSFIASAVSMAVAGAAVIAAAAAAHATILGIPLAVWLTGIAIGLFVLAAAAFATAAVLAGQLVAAEQDSNAKATARSAWDAEVANARNEVNMKCPLAEASACLSRTAPC
jgi:hypothetical protein